MSFVDLTLITCYGGCRSEYLTAIGECIERMSSDSSSYVCVHIHLGFVVYVISACSVCIIGIRALRSRAFTLSKICMTTFIMSLKMRGLQ